MLAGAAAAWVSRKQLIGSLSSMDAETYAASLAAADIIHHIELVGEIGVPMKLGSAENHKNPSSP
eukprot:2863074-Prymnesium_polylepis.3